MEYYLNIFTYKSTFFETTPVLSFGEALQEKQDLLEIRLYSANLHYIHTLKVTSSTIEILSL